MSNIVPFDSGKLPAYLARRTELANINADVVTTAPYGRMSIKGKQFTLVRDGVRKVLMKPAPDEDEAVQKIEVAALRINMHARTFYLKAFDEDDAAGAPPDCQTFDGVRPASNVRNKQSDSCATCPHSVWGTGNKEKGTGRACGDGPLMAIATPDKLDEAWQLRVPPASIKNWKDAVKLAKTRNIPYNALVYRISFDKEAASPILQFKPVGLLDDAGYEKASGLYDGEQVRAICGLDEPPAAATGATPQPASTGSVAADELDAALAARAATSKAAASAKPPAPAPAPAPAAVSETELDMVAPSPAPAPAARKKAAAPTPAPTPAPAPAPAATGDDDLLSGLDTLLGNHDD